MSEPTGTRLTIDAVGPQSWLTNKGREHRIVIAIRGLVVMTLPEAKAFVGEIRDAIGAAEAE